MAEPVTMLDVLHGLDSIQVCPSDTVQEYTTKREQFRFPRSKKRRIRKKWAKDPRNWRTVNDGLALFLYTDPITGRQRLLLHTKTWQKIKTALHETPAHRPSPRANRSSPRPSSPSSLSTLLASTVRPRTPDITTTPLDLWRTHFGGSGGVSPSWLGSLVR